MTRLFLGLAVLVTALWAVPALAYVGLCCAKCGGNMPMNIPGGGVPETHEFRFKLTPMFMRMDGLRSGTTGVNPDDLLGMPAMGKFMAAQTAMDMRMLNLAVGYSFTDDFFGGLMFMWQDKRMNMKFSSTMAGPMMAGVPGFTMESRGMADTMLMTKYRLLADDPLVPTRQMSLFLGLNIPTGSIDEKNGNHPLAIRKVEQLPYGMQLGSGTFDPVLGLLYQGSASPWWWGANAMATLRLYDNAREYRLGDRYTLDLYAMRQVAFNLLGHVQLNGEWRGDIGGVMDEFANGLSGRVDTARDDGVFGGGAMTPLWLPDTYGGTKAFATAGVQWQPVPLHIMDLSVQVPLYQNLNGPQLEDDFRVMLTWYKELPTRASIRHPDHPIAGPRDLGF